MKWYKKEAVYQIYPRSFQDSNDDGIGDLQGIIRRLDYIKSLGAGIIWLSPIYQSPMDDNGYDISDYYRIHSDYGTMDDFDQLLDHIHRTGLKLVMDLVINHTSDEHPWFVEAKKSKDNPKHDYYIWKDHPNNWTGFFGGPAWEYNPETQEYYLHLFSKKQPDLNWENPEVRDEIKKMLRFWLDKGVDGFRCDVINLLSKTPALPRGKPSLILCGKEHYINGPRIHEYLKELKTDVFDHYDCFTVGECVFLTPRQALAYIENEKELNMVFQFEHMSADCFFIKWFPRTYRPIRLKKALSRWQNQVNPTGWNTLYLENHDQPRSVSRFGSLRYHYESATMLASWYLLQKGTPFIYEGQEIGMTNAPFTGIEEYRDVETLSIYRQFKRLFGHKKMMSKIMKMSRDHARTPMQWDKTPYSGFSHVEPWLGINPNYSTINVEANLANPHSIYHFYQQILTLRHQYPSLLEGDYQELYPNHRDIFFYTRFTKDETCIIVGNMKSIRRRLPSADSLHYPIILSNYQTHHDYLAPYEVRVYLKEK
ncbi:MAG: alpha-glucosidase [Bacilli bacterium]